MRLRPALFPATALLAALVLLASPATAQVLFPGQTGDDLVAALVTTYRPTQVLSLDASKDRLYDTVDRVTVDGQDGTHCIYTGYFVPFDCLPSCDPSQDVYNNGQGIDQEHTWPRSVGAGSGFAERDLHHLFPSRSAVNSARGNLPFGESPDANTSAWYYLDQQQATPPPVATRDLWSERLGGTLFEPREDAKGDVARAIFYFYTMYGPQGTGQANVAFFEGMRDVLLAWHAADPPTAEEVARGQRVAQFQTSASGQPAVNPYVVDPTLAGRAFGGATAQPVVHFASASAAVPAAPGTFDVAVRLTGTDAASVTVAYAGGTAVPGVDFAFADQVLTFAGTSEHTVPVTLLGDRPGTLLLELRHPSTGVAIGSPATFTLTLLGETGTAELWVNELHYDNEGTDTGEFVEIALATGTDPARVTLTLYNGSGGAPYGSYSGADWTAGASAGAFTFYHVALPANGLQNGAPDGLAVDLDGDVVQFLSYEGTFTASGGPADGMTSTDIGVEQTGTTPVGTSLSLTGTGAAYGDFVWTAGTAATPGTPNQGQALATTTSEPTATPARSLAVYPNPARGPATVAFDLAEPGRVSVAVFDLLGRRVLTLFDGSLPAGAHTLPLRDERLVPGTYVVRTAGSLRETALVHVVR